MGLGIRSRRLRALLDKDVLAVALNVASLVQTGPHFKVTKATAQCWRLMCMNSSLSSSQVCSESLLEIAPSEQSVSHFGSRFVATSSAAFTNLQAA